jgi:23S rRNA (cytidine1920-2'-O)/16S rRNA (cytidine1409-2'-O)-methyltransferase
MTNKTTLMRADLALVQCGFAKNRTEARALVLAGSVHTRSQQVNKPGMMIPVNSGLAVKDRGHPWVSRGGIKLAYGLDHFNISPKGLVCLDIGASTGGFTDVLLSRSAIKVYAIDVGYGQLAWKLRQDNRVVVLERTNARFLTSNLVSDSIEFLVCDASFISLTKVLPAGMALVRPGGSLVALIKPQFEVGKGRVTKGGIIRDPALHWETCAAVRGWLETQTGWHVLGLTESPITGLDGNTEFLVAASRN